MGTCPNIPTPPPSCGGGPCHDAMPFDAATGAVEQNFSFLQTGHGSIDLTWYNLYQSAGNPIDPARGMGSNWSARQFAEVIVDNVNNAVAVMFAPGRAGCNGGGPGGGGGGPGGGGGGGGCNGGAGTGVQASNTYWFAVDSSFHLPQPPIRLVSDVWRC